MNKTLLPTLLVATVAGGAAAMITTVVARPEPSARRSTATPELGAVSGSGGEEASMVAGLRKENDDLRLRVASLESTMRRLVEAGTSADSRAPLAAESLDAVTPESAALRDLMEAFASDGGVPDVFVARVGEAMDEIRAAEDAARLEAEGLAQAERVEDRLVRMRDELGLSAYQVDEMRGILLAEETRRSELWSSVREGTDRETMRDRMREAREEQSTRLSEVLDPDQLERYQESRGRGFGGLGLGGGRGDDGDVGREERRGRDRPARTRG